MDESVGQLCDGVSSLNINPRKCTGCDQEFKTTEKLHDHQAVKGCLFKKLLRKAITDEYVSYSKEDHPKPQDKQTFTRTMFGKSWPNATVLVLDIQVKQEESTFIRLVVKNLPGEHAEQRLKVILDKVKEDHGERLGQFLSQCTFSLYMNWAPCSICCRVLADLFSPYNTRCDVRFIGLYHPEKTENIVGWIRLKRDVNSLKFMRKREFIEIGIEYGSSDIDSSIERHTSRALKMATYDQDKLKTLLESM